MATATNAASPKASAEQAGPAPVEATRPAASAALVPVAAKPVRGDLLSPGGPVARLPVELDVGVPVRGFRVRNLIALAPGAVVESQWNHGEDVPIAAGDVQLAWCEFEVLETQLAVRMTRLA